MASRKCVETGYLAIQNLPAMWEHSVQHSTLSRCRRLSVTRLSDGCSGQSITQLVSVPDAVLYKLIYRGDMRQRPRSPHLSLRNGAAHQNDILTLISRVAYPLFSSVIVAKSRSVEHHQFTRQAGFFGVGRQSSQGTADAAAVVLPSSRSHQSQSSHAKNKGFPGV
jgi:hypothetical protein